MYIQLKSVYTKMADLVINFTIRPRLTQTDGPYDQPLISCIYLAPIIIFLVFFFITILVLKLIYRHDPLTMMITSNRGRWLYQYKHRFSSRTVSIQSLLLPRPCSQILKPASTSHFLLLASYTRRINCTWVSPKG